jgi:hypothetical protein
MLHQPIRDLSCSLVLYTPSEDVVVVVVVVGCFNLLHQDGSDAVMASMGLITLTYCPE